ncbi:hypothetical protein [Aquimarina brevivitae]|uniref:Outer membrane protein beta-barrel domain-containing protein n=1 Tax=Aquimarina brevivitae TaxID=323412 RepID=A0A4Q7NZJ3_9FLAO|nr:hypothetical protein [Aquimarina brevivitae]RZS92480.1 hypothetical protein EV197_2618 [Aquimarina brevivitae]
MKKTVLVFAIALLGITTANAQFKIGFGAGYAVPAGDIADFTDGGISAYLELGYGVNEQIDVTFLYSADVLVGADISEDGMTGSIGNVVIASYLANGRYFFKEQGFRPYAGLGLGLASIGAIEVEGASGNVTASTSNFAFRPALGFKYGVLNMNAAYLNAGKTGEASVSDISFNIGLLFTIGGN